MPDAENSNVSERQAGAIGPRIKALRAARHISQRKLAEMIGTTASFVSQFERNLCGANTGTLMRIAAALDVGLNDLFENNDWPLHEVLSRAARPAVSIGDRGRKTLLSRRPIHAFEVYTGEFDVGGSTGAETYTHGGKHEMFIVLKGTVELTLADQRFVMREGDSMEYATSTPHRTVNVGETPAEVLWIIAPPTSVAVELDQYRPEDRSHSG